MGMYQDSNDSVVVVVNMTESKPRWYAIGFPRADCGKRGLNSDSYNYGPNFYNHPTPDVETHKEGVDGLPCSGEISIGPTRW